MWSRITSALAGMSFRTMVQAIKPHIPLIKFPSRSSVPGFRSQMDSAGNPDTTDRVINTVHVTQNPDADSKRLLGASFDVLKIPQKYKRKPLSKEEMEIIEKGGPV